MSNLLSPPPTRTPMLDANGQLTVAWLTWFGQVAGIGGVTGSVSYLKNPSGNGTITVVNGIITAIT